jgi:hypothetical protein
MEEYLNERQEFITEINDKDEQIATQKQVVLSKDREIEKKLLENSNLDRLNSQIKVKFQTQIKDIIASYEEGGDGGLIVGTDTIHDTLIVEKPIGVKFGTKFKLDTDPWYYAGGSITDKGVLFDSLSFKNSITITVGKKRDGWLKPMETLVEVKSENPYTGITGLNNVTINKKKETIWTKPWFNLLVGIGGGFIIGAIATN